MLDGRRRLRFHIRLRGSLIPVQGDGTSDNQNHAIIFVRVGYVQLVDATQDNYLEKALKVRSVLGEFGQQHTPDVLSFSHQTTSMDAAELVAIRMVAKVGGRHLYGQPDFPNLIFMTTRGGATKAWYLRQNDGLQPWMDDQTRKTQPIWKGAQSWLWIDSPSQSAQLFMLSMLFIGPMSSSVAICSDKAQEGSINLVPVYDWIERWILSIFVSFLPLILQGFTERPSLYLRMRIPLILVFASMAMWVPHLVYFWVTISHDHLSTPVRLHRASTGLLRVLEMAAAWKLHTTSWIS
ncbi:MAG: 1,3-beta-glucan synthase component-domain-containing protein [Benniella sp.]|nr:MAG: 1,3-beta-glucan synthase component-domain-containing protein [Benniella sp.]